MSYPSSSESVLQRYEFPDYSVPDKNGEIPMADFVMHYDMVTGYISYYEWTFDVGSNTLMKSDVSYIGGLDDPYDWQENTLDFRFLKIELDNQKVTFSMAPDSTGYPGDEL